MLETPKKIKYAPRKDGKRVAQTANSGSQVPLSLHPNFPSLCSGKLLAYRQPVVCNCRPIKDSAREREKPPRF